MCLSHLCINKFDVIGCRYYVITSAEGNLGAFICFLHSLNVNQVPAIERNTARNDTQINLLREYLGSWTDFFYSQWFREGSHELDKYYLCSEILQNLH